MAQHKVFISYYHADDQKYKNALTQLNAQHGIFIDMSVDTNDIDDTGKNSEQIRRIIRDEYLRDSPVTIILVGPNTKNRKHVDWEIFSSMYDGTVNKKSGILVINLPEIGQSMRVSNPAEKKLFPSITEWVSFSEQEIDSKYPYLPERILDNLKKDGVRISVIDWDKINTNSLGLLIDNAFNNRTSNQYDLSRSMMGKNKS